MNQFRAGARRRERRALRGLHPLSVHRLGAQEPHSLAVRRRRARGVRRSAAPASQPKRRRRFCWNATRTRKSRCWCAFLQVEARQVEAWSGSSFEPVESLAVGAQTYLTFDEGVEREVPMHLAAWRAATGRAVPIAFGDEETRRARCAMRTTRSRGRIVRRRWPLHGAIAVECEPVDGQPGLAQAARSHRKQFQRRAGRTQFGAAHGVRFDAHAAARARRPISLRARSAGRRPREATTQLANRHTWPVLVGDESADAQRSPLVLSSPIILYDFPAVAPQSEGERSTRPRSTS